LELQKFKKRSGALFKKFKKDRDCPLEWWCSHTVQFEFPALSRVAVGFYGMLPGSGCLENDIGQLGHILSQKRASLSPGMAEAMMLVKLNKELRTNDVSKIPKLDSKDWTDKIPDRVDLFSAYNEEEDYLVAGDDEAEDEAVQSDEESVMNTEEM
jgi:hypothetical protein